MKKLLKVSSLVFLSASLFISCKKDSVPDITPEIFGHISGKIVAANHTTAIRVATVFIYSNGQTYITQTDVNGSFVLEAPAGNQHLTIQTGDGSMFRTEMNVSITEGQTTAISSQPIQLNQVANLAYIPGIYDKIERILIDSMGYTATALTWPMINTLSNITGYDAIFINCTGESDMQTISGITDSNLADYVANGGSLYVSDWANKCLIGKHNLQSDPCSTERVGGFIADSLLCARRSGISRSIMNAAITSSSLQAYLNKNTINEIVYNLGSWEEIHYLDNNFWETMVTDTAGTPLLIRTNQYSNPQRGTISIGSAANNGYSRVCVRGSGNDRFTLSVKTSDVPSLLAQGATMGSCANSTGSGRIYYTTFHNEPNGHIGEDIKNILQYVILDL